MAAAETQHTRGRPAGATREQVLARATADWLEGRRIDVQAIAAACGVGRATVYRWFGSREQLIGEATVQVVERQIAEARAAVGGEGPRALLDTFDLIYRRMSSAPYARAFVEHEPALAVTIITSSTGPVHPRVVAAIQALIEREAARGHVGPVSPPTLAYVVVRLAEGILFHHDAGDATDNLDRLHAVAAELLGAGS